MNMPEFVFQSFELEKEALEYEEDGSHAKAREVKTKWCHLRDALTGIEKDQFIAAAVAVETNKYLSDEAMKLLKVQDQVAYEVHMALFPRDL